MALMYAHLAEEEADVLDELEKEGADWQHHGQPSMLGSGGQMMNHAQVDENEHFGDSVSDAVLTKACLGEGDADHGHGDGDAGHEFGHEQRDGAVHGMDATVAHVVAGAADHEVDGAVHPVWACCDHHVQGV